VPRIARRGGLNVFTAETIYFFWLIVCQYFRCFEIDTRYKQGSNTYCNLAFGGFGVQLIKARSISYNGMLSALCICWVSFKYFFVGLPAYCYLN